MKVRDTYAQAGVRIEIVKFDGLMDMDESELDYCFRLAKAVGARAISGEPSLKTARRAAPIARLHRIWPAMHNHLAITPAIFEEVLACGPYVAASLDIGHYVAGTLESPVPFIRKHHKRITHLHIKDKTFADVNVELGKGDTPIAETLRVLRDEKWRNVAAIIEYEIAAKPGEDRVVELTKEIYYCKAALLS